jgi:chromosome segregation ATPase
MAAHYQGAWMKMGRRKDPAEQVEPEQIQRGDADENGPALEQRLQALVELERETRDLFEQREAEQLAASKAEAEQRLVEAEAALAEAQTREHQQRETERSLVEMENNLVDAWSEVTSVRDELAEARRQAAEELAEARREADEARKEIKPRSERRVAEVQEALAKARAEIELERTLRAELEQRLDTVEQSEQEARLALQQRVPAAEVEEAEQRIATLEELIAGARAEAEREREQRGEMERRLETLVAQEAEANRALAESELKRAEAERTAGEAREALNRVRVERDHERKQLLAIDEELQALVTSGESARTALEDEPGPEGPPAEQPPLKEGEEPVRDEERSEAEEHEPDQITEPVPPLLEALGPAQPRETARPQEPDELMLEENDIPEASDTAPKPSPTGRGRRRSRGRRSQNQSRACTVCQRASPAQSPKQLIEAGWNVVGEAVLCPDCQSLGWQLPEEGGLPFRRSSAGQTSS